MINIIVACDLNGGIGYKNKIPWHIRDDLLRFKFLTEGHIVVMGYNTWLSLPIKPLPNRLNVVITSKHITSVPTEDGVFVSNDVVGTINLLYKKHGAARDIYIIGGESIYNLVLNLDLIDSIIVTHIQLKYDKVDSFFPINRLLQSNKWKLSYPFNIDKTYEAIPYIVRVLNRKRV